MLESLYPNQTFPTGYGWKWEVSLINIWESYFANYVKLNNYDVRKYPFYLLYGGRVRSGILDLPGWEGRYQSSTAYITNFAYYILLSTTNIYPASFEYRYFGFSIRCLAR